MRILLLLTVATLFAGHVAPSETITFSGTTTPSPSGCYTEGNFTFCSVAGTVGFYNAGNPGQDAEGSLYSTEEGPQFLTVYATSGSLFTFEGLAYAAWDYNYPGLIGRVDVDGYLGTNEVGSDEYTVESVETFPYTN
jgi:hypothetical protein